jgi:hypothetical protein
MARQVQTGFLIGCPRSDGFLLEALAAFLVFNIPLLHFQQPRYCLASLESAFQNPLGRVARKRSHTAGMVGFSKARSASVTTTGT